MFKGNKINLRIMEKEDIPTYAKWMNDPDFIGEFFIPLPRSVAAHEKMFLESPQDNRALQESATFIIEIKDGKPAGWIAHFMSRFGGYMAVKEIGYMITPDHRGKGFASEAVTMMVDFLFLDKEWQRIQAIIAEENVASKRAAMPENEFWPTRNTGGSWRKRSLTLSPLSRLHTTQG